MTEPPVIPGELVSQAPAIQASAVMDPISMATHKFTQLIRKMILNTPGAFKTEGEVMDAIRTIETFERHLIPQRDRNLVKSPDDPAPIEDVTQRVPPRGGTPPPVPSAGPQIDYAALAQAILTAQANIPEPPAPPTPSEDAVSEPARDDSTN